MKTNKETRRSIARKSFLLKIFSKLYLAAATIRSSLKLVFRKCWQQKQLYSGTTIFKEHLLPAATLYNKGLFLLTSYVALAYNFEQLILSISNVHVCSSI